MKPRLIPISIAVAAAIATTAFLAAPALASHPLLPTIPTLPGTALPLPTTTNGPGATVPFTEYEAENARTTGTVLAPSRAFTPARRRSLRTPRGLTERRPVRRIRAREGRERGRRALLDPGRPPTRPCTSAVNGVAAADLTLTAAYSHFYGNYPFTNNAADGGEHHYFDDVRTMFGTRSRPAPGYACRPPAPRVIDLADFESVAPAAAAPAGYLDVTDFGADATGATDSCAGDPGRRSTPRPRQGKGCGSRPARSRSPASSSSTRSPSRAPDRGIRS